MTQGVQQQPVPDWCLDMMIDGKRVRGEGGLVAVDNPATEELLVKVPAASSDQIDAAVHAARRAFDSGVWRDPELRHDVMLRLADLITEHTAALQTALIHEVGTPIALCEPMQVGEPVRQFRWHAEQALVDRTRVLPRVDGPPATEALIRYEPAGVVAAISAYNYPLLIAAVKLGAAMAAGCTAVLLPSFQTPLATLMFADLVREAGFPPGVINVVVGGPEVGRALTMHPGIDKVSFTGSVDVGRQVMAQASEGIKRVALELGGKSASIVLPSADLEAITTAVHARYLRNAGQGCTSPTRILVHEDQYDDFVDLSRDALAQIQVGDPWDPSTVAGPLISERHRARVEGYVERALADGGTVLAGGGRPDLARGWYMNSTLIGDLDNSSELAQNELFGPVGMVMPFRTLDEAVATANESDYGLQASLWGPVDEAREIAPKLRVGSVMINGWGPRLDGVQTGYKKSGIGRELGEEGIMEYLEAQFVTWLV